MKSPSMASELRAPAGKATRLVLKVCSTIQVYLVSPLWRR